MDVAIDGDVAVVAASVRRTAKEWRTGLAYVYERHGAEWSIATRIETAAPTGAPWSPRVECSVGRIAVFCPYPVTPERSIFRTYTRDASGAWALEQEVPTRQPFGGDAAMSGDVIAVLCGDEIEVFRRREGQWQSDQRIAAAEVSVPWRMQSWIALAGTTMAVAGIASSPDENPPPTTLLRGGAGGFSLETTLDDRESKFAWLRCLARRGNAVLTKSRWGALEVRERNLTGWDPTLAFSRGVDLVVPKAFCRPMAADGDLVVLAPGAGGAFQILERREDGWYRATIDAPNVLADLPATVSWLHAEANVAVSGRSVIVGTRWDAESSGRAWLFDITDDDLARATKLESDPPK